MSIKTIRPRNPARVTGWREFIHGASGNSGARTVDLSRFIMGIVATIGVMGQCVRGLTCQFVDRGVCELRSHWSKGAEEQGRKGVGGQRRAGAVSVEIVDNRPGSHARPNL